MCGSASVWAKLSLLLITFAMVFQIVGWATVSWMMYGYNGARTRVGLWNYQSCSSAGVCTSDVVPSSLKNHSFRSTQAMETLAFIIVIVAPFMVAVYVFSEKYRIWNLAVACMVACFLVAIFVTIGMVVWLTYIPSPYVCSWSMGMTVIAGILALIAGFLLIPEVEDNDEYYFGNKRRNSYTPPPYSNRNGTTTYIGDRTTYSGTRDTPTPPSRSRSRDSDIRSPSSISTHSKRTYDVMPAPMGANDQRSNRGKSPKTSKSVSPKFKTDSPNPGNKKKIYDYKPTSAVPDWSNNSPYVQETNIDDLPGDYKPATFNNVSEMRLQRDKA